LAFKFLQKCHTYAPDLFKFEIITKLYQTNRLNSKISIPLYSVQRQNKKQIIFIYSLIADYYPICLLFDLKKLFLAVRICAIRGSYYEPA